MRPEHANSRRRRKHKYEKFPSSWKRVYRLNLYRIWTNRAPQGLQLTLAPKTCPLSTHDFDTRAVLVLPTRKDNITRMLHLYYFDRATWSALPDDQLRNAALDRWHSEYPEAKADPYVVPVTCRVRPAIGLRTYIGKKPLQLSPVDVYGFLELGSIYRPCSFDLDAHGVATLITYLSTNERTCS